MIGGWRPKEFFEKLSFISGSESQKTFGLRFGLNVGHHSIERFDYLISFCIFNDTGNKLEM